MADPSSDLDLADEPLDQDPDHISARQVPNDPDGDQQRLGDYRAVALEVNDAATSIIATVEILLQRERRLSVAAVRDLQAIQLAARSSSKVLAGLLGTVADSTETFLPGAEINAALHLYRGRLQNQGIHLEIDLGEDLQPVTGQRRDLHAIVRHVVRTNLAEGQGWTYQFLKVTMKPRAEGSSVLLDFIFSGHLSGGTRAAVDASVRALGGTWDLTVETDGTRILIVRLPVAAQGGGRTPTTTGSLRQGRLLLLEDEDMVRRLLAQHLRLAGHEVDAFSTAAEAIRAFRGSAYDALVVDLNLPGMDGLGFLMAAREIRRSLPPTLICTGHVTALERVKLVDLGVTDVLLKPFSGRILAEHIQGLLDRVGRT